MKDGEAVTLHYICMVVACYHWLSKKITSNSRHLVLLDATHITKKKNNFEITLWKQIFQQICYLEHSYG
jgi:hypothetical protein